MRGTESEVAGMISATSSMKTVRESRTVMPSGDRQSGEKRERHATNAPSLFFYAPSLFPTCADGVGEALGWQSLRAGLTLNLLPSTPSITLGDRGIFYFFLEGSVRARSP